MFKIVAEKYLHSKINESKERKLQHSGLAAQISVSASLSNF